MGYYSRRGYATPYYYSPRRIFGVLRRCGVDEFVVSSTCAQIASIRIDDIVQEAEEMRRLAGRKAHVFFWLSGHLYDEDPDLGWLNTGLFDGIKLHEGETPWIGERFRELCHVIEMAEDRNLPIQMHAGATGVAQPRRLKVLALQFPHVRFDFAHCRPMDEMAQVVAECPNVWTDTAYLDFDAFACLRNYDWQGRLLFGTDLPVWQAYGSAGLTQQYRRYVDMFRSVNRSVDKAFDIFLSKNCPGTTPEKNASGEIVPTTLPSPIPANFPYGVSNYMKIRVNSRATRTHGAYSTHVNPLTCVE